MPYTEDADSLDLLMESMGSTIKSIVAELEAISSDPVNVDNLTDRELDERFEARLQSLGVDKDLLRKETRDDAKRVFDAARGEITAYTTVESAIAAPIEELRLSRGEIETRRKAFREGLTHSKLYWLLPSFQLEALVKEILSPVLLVLVLAPLRRLQWYGNRLRKNGKLSEAKVEADKAVQVQGIAPFWSTRINKSRSDRRYATELLPLHHPRLTEGYLPGSLGDREAVARLNNLLRTMGQGSIGIAGPRGVGKTTLIKSVGSVPRSTGQKGWLPVESTVPVDYDAREFILHLFSRACDEVEKMEGYQTWLGRKLVRPAVRPISARIHRFFETKDLSHRAYRHLKDIRFHRSYSSGWGGSLSLQGTLGAVFGRATTMSERQRSLPDIVEECRGFLKRISDYYLVVLSIDELDKVESDEKAQKFLNDIKGLFQIEGCFYLISVSESAMSKFERRGVPFRDAFDSALDEIIRLDYQNFDRSLGLIDERVTFFPVPFAAFAYCHTGRLPRDLIRTCRSLLNYVARDADNNGLKFLSGKVVALDIEAKLQGMVIAAGQLSSGQDLTQLLYEIQQLQPRLDPNIDPKMLRDTCNRLLEIGSTNSLSNGNRENHDDELNQTIALARQLAAYLYYCAALLSFVRGMKNNEAWEKEYSNGALARKVDCLSKARQWLARSPEVAMTITRQCFDDRSLRLDGAKESSTQAANEMRIPPR